MNIEDKESAIRWLARTGAVLQFREDRTQDAARNLYVSATIPVHSESGAFQFQTALMPKWIENNLAGVLTNVARALRNAVKAQELRLIYDPEGIEPNETSNAGGDAPSPSQSASGTDQPAG